MLLAEHSLPEARALSSCTASARDVARFSARLRPSAVTRKPNYCGNAVLSDFENFAGLFRVDIAAAHRLSPQPFGKRLRKSPRSKAMALSALVELKRDVRA